MHDTIVGIATASGGAPRGVIRLSGPKVVSCLEACFHTSDASEPGRGFRSRRSPYFFPTWLPLVDALGELPGELYVWPTPRSYTRQPSAEFHTIGSPPLLDAAVRTFIGQGARLAAPGEFTMRAFLAGRLDLTQAEAVLGVIDARDGQELQVALTQLAGGLTTPLHQLREQLLELLARLEAGLDFVDEDIEFVSPIEVACEITKVRVEMTRLNRQIRARSTGERTPQVVLCGPPNVGKSSLFNALTGDSRAIVSQIPGTTRDYLTCDLEVERVRFTLVDTAGLDDDVVHPMESQAQSMAKRQGNAADVLIVCRDATAAAHPETVLDRDTGFDETTSTEPLLVWTKCDGTPTPPSEGLPTSAKTGLGLDALRQAIAGRCRRTGVGGLAAVPATLTRCRATLDAAEQTLSSAARLADVGGDEVLIAAEIRSALDRLGEVVGAVHTDDLLDRIFSRFCIGK